MNFQVIDNKRKALRYTVTDFCDQIGIDRTSYYKYLQDPSSMKISTWEKMVQLLGMTAAERKESLK